MNTEINNPLISMLMPAYNREDFIAESIQSILNQTFTNFELVIVDDGSTDNTVMQINNFTDNRIRLLQNEKNCGIAVTRNRLITEAKGQYFAILDSDDIALPDRLQIQYNYLVANPSVILIGSAIIGINEKGNPINNKGAVLKKPTDADEIKATLLFRNCFFQSSVMINAQLFNNTKYDTNFPPLEDYELWTRLSFTNTLKNLDEPLVKYRFHPTNVTHTTKEAHKFDLINKIAVQKFKFHFNYTPTQQELYTHNAWQFNLSVINYSFLKDSSNWLKKVKKLNSEKKEFEQSLFLKVLKENWFQRCWYFLEKGNIWTAFYFLFFNIGFSLKDIKTFFYFFIKAIPKVFKK